MHTNKTVIILLIPVNFAISLKIARVSRVIAVQRDTRVAATLELVQRIGAVKVRAGNHNSQALVLAFHVPSI